MYIGYTLRGKTDKWRIFGGKITEIIESMCTAFHAFTVYWNWRFMGKSKIKTSFVLKLRRQTIFPARTKTAKKQTVIPFKIFIVSCCLNIVHEDVDVFHEMSKPQLTSRSSVCYSGLDFPNTQTQNPSWRAYLWFSKINRFSVPFLPSKTNVNMPRDTDCGCCEAQRAFVVCYECGKGNDRSSLVFFLTTDFQISVFTKIKILCTASVQCACILLHSQYAWFFT
jgi:hypothetical protein